ncbi:MAG: hypothetical protein U0V64_01845 [Cyclobacteriaceae bacterium]
MKFLFWFGLCYGSSALILIGVFNPDYYSGQGDFRGIAGVVYMFVLVEILLGLLLAIYYYLIKPRIRSIKLHYAALLFVVLVVEYLSVDLPMGRFAFHSMYQIILQSADPEVAMSAWTWVFTVVMLAATTLAYYKVFGQHALYGELVIRGMDGSVYSEIQVN